MFRRTDHERSKNLEDPFLRVRRRVGPAGSRARTAIDLGPLLAPEALPPGPSDAILLVQARLGANQSALRLVQMPGQELAMPVATVAFAADSPAARDDFVAWALRTYPTRHTLLILRDCQLDPADQPAASGSVFSVVGPASAPDFWPLTEAGLGEMADQFATRGLGAWLASLANSLAGQLSITRPAPKPQQPAIPKETPPMQPQREWTILLYMAGDNGATFQGKYGKYSLMAEMTGAGITDIAEVETVGTTDQVAVLAQFDTLPSKDPLAKELGTEAGGTYRLEIHQGHTTLENIVEVMPDVNTGDPAELARFIVWGMNRCPAKRTMLVLWNHGLGWKDDDIYAKVRGMSRSAAQGRNARGSNAALFRSTAKSISRRASRTRSSDARAILCDDTSMDFLTNKEMSQALRVAEFAADEADAMAIFSDKARLDQLMSWGNEGALRHLNIIGMDACLMAMIEVQYQVRQFADVMVASQEVEPMNGWPYHKILTDLNDRPTMSPQELSTIIVDRFVESYVNDSRRRPDVTQSAIDLSRYGRGRKPGGNFRPQPGQRVPRRSVPGKGLQGCPRQGPARRLRLRGPGIRRPGQPAGRHDQGLPRRSQRIQDRRGGCCAARLAAVRPFAGDPQRSLRQVRWQGPRHQHLHTPRPALAAVQRDRLLQRRLVQRCQQDLCGLTSSSRCQVTSGRWRTIT
jgi:hypothetical protein